MNTNLPFHDLISTHVPTSPLCYYFTALVCIHDRHDSLHVIINVFYSVNSSTLGIKTNLTAGNIQSPRPRLAGFTWRHRKHYGPGRLRDATRRNIRRWSCVEMTILFRHYSYYYYLSSWALYNDDMLRQSSGLPSLIVVSYWTRHVVGLNRRTRGYI